MDPTLKTSEGRHKGLYNVQVYFHEIPRILSIGKSIETENSCCLSPLELLPLNKDQGSTIHN